MLKLVRSCSLIMLVAVCCSTPVVVSAQENDEATVYVIEGSKGSIGEKDTARIEVGGISGTSIEAVIDGPAKLKRSNIVTMVDGRIPIGAIKAELNVHPTGTGLVTLKVTIKSPANPTADVKIYKIMVK